jgi:hypothetical protein
LNDSLTKNANDIVEKKIQEIASLETEIAALKINLVKLESDKSSLEAAKNNEIKNLVSKILT